MPHRWILHVDMDAFYASVEQHDQPNYRNKPVIVGADPQGGHGRGVVAAASYEARRFGIHSAMPISHAFQRCPHGIFLRGRMRRYQEVSSHIFSIFRRYTDLNEALSLDEAFLDVTGSLRLHGSPEMIGRKIQASIQKEEGLSASVGVAANKFVAKIGSDLRKPQGFVVVNPGEEAAFLYDLPLERLWGAGPKTATELRRLGCTTIGDVARYPEREFFAAFGTQGRYLQDLSRGIDSRAVEPDGPAKSMGAETTFDEDTGDPTAIRHTLLQLAEEVGHRLRRAHMITKSLTLKFRDETFHTQTRSLACVETTDQAHTLYLLALELLNRIPKSKKKVRLLGLTASKLSDTNQSGNQLSLFYSEGEKERQLTATLDELQTKFGEDVIARASLLTKKNGRTPRENEGSQKQ